MAVSTAVAIAIQALLLLLVTLVLVLLLFRWRRNAAKWNGLPPWLPAWPIVGHLPKLLATTNSGASAFEDLVRRSLRSLGRLFTLWLPGAPLVIVADAALAHEALISKGAAFADRPIPRGFRAVFSHGGRTINASRYGPLWRTLRANLVSGILSPASLGHFRRERRQVLDRLVHDLVRESASSESGEVRPRKHLRLALFRIVAALCFGVGSNDDDAALEELMAALHQMLRSGLSLNSNPVVALMPWKWRQARQIRRRIYEAVLPFMRRAQAPSYVSTLRDAAAAVGVAADDEQYMAVLCSEFLVGATDTTATSIEWALAHITRLPEVQRRLHREVAAAYAEEKEEEEEEEEDLVCSGKVQYVEAVVMETLRRNPPGHFVLNHAVTEETEVAGYRLPAQTVVNFYVHGIGMDAEVWEAPQEFRPERFITRGGGDGKTWWDEDKEKDEDEEVSSAKKRLLRMMPFGAGRRICPGMGLALLHMHLFVARLVRCFEWKEVSPIDMTESLNFTTQMKEPLCALISQR